MIMAVNRPKVPTRQLVKAAGVFAKTPLHTVFKNRIPARSEVMGGPRRKFDLNVFVLESWKAASGRKKVNPNSFLAMETFSKYITRVDDLLDRVDHESFVTNPGSYRRDSLARARISGFVQGVHAMHQSGQLTKVQRNQIYRLAGNYRRLVFPALAKFEKIQKPTITDSIEYKEKTTGGMGAVLVDILGVAEKISLAERERLATAFSNSFMSTQIADDIKDIHEDRRNKVGNLAIVFLEKNPHEYDKVMELKDINIKNFRKAAPVSYDALMHLSAHYLREIPVTPKSIQVMQAIPTLFFKLLHLTSRGSS